MKSCVQQALITFIHREFAFAQKYFKGSFGSVLITLLRSVLISSVMPENENDLTDDGVVLMTVQVLQ